MNLTRTESPRRCDRNKSNHVIDGGGACGGGGGRGGFGGEGGGGPLARIFCGPRFVDGYCSPDLSRFELLIEDFDHSNVISPRHIEYFPVPRAVVEDERQYRAPHLPTGELLAAMRRVDSYHALMSFGNSRLSDLIMLWYCVLRRVDSYRALMHIVANVLCSIL
ncbi:serine carboxypeptidase-like 18 [Dorcoceras hygrometricum]|uniref:Serine carboxypeptidase-like 18 n=1 Tax=Dorcoceras hygrometricum TaxID=472368 RepID=A0A2Z7BA58_9LAMI|nr:serine carboxypeptidase-like 18 [Dorcoceras hygrometricum]